MICISWRKHERGFGMLEVGLALVVVAFAAAGLSKMLTSNVSATKAKSNAERLAMVTLAADQYLIQNEQALKTVLPAGGAPIAIPVGKTCATCPVPSGPSGLPSVQGDGLLSSAYVDLNNNQQSHALLVKELASGDLDAIVTTYGGSPIDDENLGYITGLIGAAAGGVYTNAAIAPTNQISGAHGGWGDATSSWNASIGGTSVRPSSGHVQVSLSLAQASGMGAIDPDDVLFRTSNGNATRNTMATDLRMGANSIRDANEVHGRIFRDATTGQTGFYVDPGATSRINALEGTGNLDFGPIGAPTVQITPTGADTTWRIVSGTATGTRSVITGDGRIFADNRVTAGSTTNFQVFAKNDGIMHADQKVTVGTMAAPTIELWRSGTIDATRSINAGINLNATTNVNAGADVNAGDDLNAVDAVNAGGNANITGGAYVGGDIRSTSGTIQALNGMVRAGTNTGPRSTLHEDGTIQATKGIRAPNFVSGATIESIPSPANGIAYLNGMYDVTTFPGVPNYFYRVNPSDTDSRLRKLTVGQFGNPTAVIEVDGDIVTPGNVTAAAYYYSSDERLKEDIKDLDGWSVIEPLEPKSYRIKKDGRKSMGLIAQDVEKVVPDLVQTDEDGMKSVNYIDLIGPMIDTIQELMADNQILRAEIQEIRSAID